MSLFRKPSTLSNSLLAGRCTGARLRTNQANISLSFALGWTPTKGVENIARDIFRWLEAEEQNVRPIFL